MFLKNVQAGQRDLSLDILKTQRRVVSDTTKLLSQLRLEVTAGVEAVDEVFHTAGGDEDMTDEEKKLLKKFNAKKEKEQKELAQLKAQQAVAKQAADNYSYKWTGGAGADTVRGRTTRERRSSSTTGDRGSGLSMPSSRSSTGTRHRRRTRRRMRTL